MYLSDLTKTQLQYIEKVLLPQEHKRKHNLTATQDTLFYYLTISCEWIIT